MLTAAAWRHTAAAWRRLRLQPGDIRAVAELPWAPRGTLVPAQGGRFHCRLGYYCLRPIDPPQVPHRPRGGLAGFAAGRGTRAQAGREALCLRPLPHRRKADLRLQCRVRRRPPPAARSLTTHAVHVLSRFDASLRARDPRWGIRDVAALDGFGAPALRRVGLDEMPANNFLAVWERQP